MEVILFPNDDNKWILSPTVNKTTSLLQSRPYHEILFRKIHQWLFKNNLINGNIIDLGSWIGDNTLPWSKMTSNIYISLIFLVGAFLMIYTVYIYLQKTHQYH